MHYENLIELHNVAELNLETNDHPSWHGQRMQRVPEAVRAHLNENSQAMMLEGAGMELRFVSDGPVRIVISTERGGGEDPPQAMIFQGDFKVSDHRSFSAGPNTIELEPNENVLALKKRQAQMLAGEVTQQTITPEFTFDPAVTRIMLPHYNGPWRLHRVEPGPGVTCRPPRAEELPALRMLAYGTSITQGASATLPHHAYAAHCARRLGADLLNIGSSGSAMCEPELADYFTQRGDWDFATLALSVNMQGCPQDEFRERVGYMVDRVAAGAPEKPVFAITLWPYFRDVAVLPEYTRPWTDESEFLRLADDIPALAERMRQDLRDMVALAQANGRSNLHLLEGPDLFGAFTGNSADLIHPSDDGMIEMGRNLAEAIRPYLAD
ncbi:MAG: SGNH/GDSL hydrolase family protein [Planctomycetota bacterium]